MICREILLVLRVAAAGVGIGLQLVQASTFLLMLYHHHHHHHHYSICRGHSVLVAATKLPHTRFWRGWFNDVTASQPVVKPHAWCSLCFPQPWLQARVRVCGRWIGSHAPSPCMGLFHFGAPFAVTRGAEMAENSKEGLGRLLQVMSG